MYNFLKLTNFSQVFKVEKQKASNKSIDNLIHFYLSIKTLQYASYLASSSIPGVSLFYR